MQTTNLTRPIEVGVFDTLEGAERAVHGLLDAGFTKEQITVVCSDDTKERHFRDFEHQEPAGTYTPAAIATGGAIGATLGALAAVAGGVAMGGVGLLFTGGIAAWSGGIVGGLIGAMMTRGVEKEIANYYDQAVIGGKILVAAEVHEGDDPRLLETAARVLDEAGAEPVPLAEG
jgi:hypothetical protein